MIILWILGFGVKGTETALYFFALYFFTLLYFILYFILGFCPTKLHIEIEALLSMDDDALLRHDEIVFAFLHLYFSEKNCT